MEQSRSLGNLPWRVSASGAKADVIANDCFYMIAMGKWLPGFRLPAVRQLESEWGANRQTILKAFRSLTDLGLLCHKPNGSYYVAEEWPERDPTRDRIDLEHLYAETLVRIRRETHLFPLHVLRMLARMAEAEAAERPEVAFVECSRAQATDHASEITERLAIPVIPLALDDIRGKRVRIPAHVRVVFTTSFHLNELRSLRRHGLTVAAVPIKISPYLLAELAEAGREVIFVESDATLAQRTTHDAVWMMDIATPHLEVTADVEAFLRDNLKTKGATSSPPIFLVSQREWERLDARWRQHPSLRPVSCTLTEAAWPIIAKVLKIPFGALVRES